MSAAGVYRRVVRVVVVAALLLTACACIGGALSVAPPFVGAFPGVAHVYDPPPALTTALTSASLGRAHMYDPPIPLSGRNIVGALGSHEGFGNITAGTLVEGQVLGARERWLGEGYREIAPGVYRSADNARQFRMTASDLGARNPRVHFESIGPNGARSSRTATST